MLAPFEEPNGHRCFGGQLPIDGIELGVHAGRDSIRENGRLLIGNVFIIDLHEVCVRATNASNLEEVYGR